MTAGTRSVVVKPRFVMTEACSVLATVPRSAGGLTTIHRVVPNAADGIFTIYLTANATRSAHVAWLAFG